MGTLDIAKRLVGMLGDLGFVQKEGDGKMVIDVKAEEVKEEGRG